MFSHKGETLLYRLKDQEGIENLRFLKEGSDTFETIIAYF